MVDARDLIQRGLLLLDSDQPADSALFAHAAGAALQLLDLVPAERLAGAAHELDGNFDAMMLHGSALSLIGRVTDAETVFANAPPAALTPEQRSGLASFRAANLYSGLGMTDRANQVVEDALARLPVDAHGPVLGFQAVMWAFDGPAPRAIDAANAVLGSSSSGIAGFGAYLALMTALGYAGRADDIADVAKRGNSIAEQSPDLSAIAFGFTEQHVQALLLAGYQSEAEVVAERWERQMIDVPVASRAYAAMLIGQTRLGAGRVADARRWLEKAMPVITRFDGEKYGSVICRCDLVVARALVGVVDDAAAALSALEAERNPFKFLDSRCELAAAWFLAADGATIQAIERAWRAAAMARRLGHFGQEVVCLQTAARFGDATTASRLEALCDVVGGPRVSAAAAHASALAAQDADGLVAASRQCERIGDTLAAADAAAHAASVYRSQDRRGSALSAQERADQLRDRCGRANTPALRAMHTAPLTARQREILELVAQGLSNRQIAQRLNLSVRSVEGHRYRAGKK